MFKGDTGSNALGGSGLKGDVATDSGLRDAVADSSSNHDTTTGTFGEQVANPHLKTVHHRPGSTDAGARAADAQAESAAHSGDLTTNYDVGGAQSAGHLRWPVADLRDRSIDPAKFSAQELSDPAIVTQLNRLGYLQARRSKLETERDHAVAERNAGNADPAKMKLLNANVDHAEAAYQGAVTGVFTQDEAVKKAKRHFDASEGAPAGSTGQTNKAN